MNHKTVPEWFTSVNQRICNWLPKRGKSVEPNRSGFSSGEMLEGTFFALGLMLLLSLLLGTIAFFRPTARVVQEESSFQHLGVFSYSALAPQGVYDVDTIKSGDPIFTKLTCTVDVNFQYTMVAPQAENVAGTYQLTAVFSEQVGGWQRIVHLQEETPFHGNAFRSSARLDLCMMETLAQTLEKETGFHPSTYTLVITPQVKLGGKISSQVLEDTFNPAITFRYDRLQFYLVRNDAQENPLLLTETGIVRRERWEANTVLLLGKEMTVRSLRLIVLFGLVVSFGGLIFLGLRLQYISQRDQEKFFRIRYGSSIIDIQDANLITASNLIDVHSMEDLARLAERFNVMILHEVHSHSSAYYVQANGITYRFMITAHETGSTVPDAASQ